MWKRKPTAIADETAPGDYLILRDRQVVGRVVPAHRIDGAVPYIWTALTFPAGHGRAASLAEAEEAVRAFVRARWPYNEMHVALASATTQGR